MLYNQAGTCYAGHLLICYIHGQADFVQPLLTLIGTESDLSEQFEPFYKVVLRKDRFNDIFEFDVYDSSLLKPTILYEGIAIALNPRNPAAWSAEMSWLTHIVPTSLGF